MFNNRNVTRKTVYGITIVLFLTAMLWSCKKEQEQYSYTGIYSFSFADTANDRNCMAFVNTDSSTIEVNWLYEWKNMDSIEPVISLAPGATVEPASGSRIAFKDGVSYTVTAQNGISKIYSLRKVVQQPRPAFVFSVDSIAVRQGGIASVSECSYWNLYLCAAYFTGYR